MKVTIKTVTGRKIDLSVDEDTTVFFNDKLGSANQTSSSRA